MKKRKLVTVFALVAGLLGPGVAPAAAQDVGGGIYLFRYQPVDFDGADGRTEVYAAFLQVAHQTGPWDFYLEARGRDNRLRAFYPGNVWFQEAWAAYRVTEDDAPASLRFRAGKTYQTTGRFWDGSFFGNIHYFDGLKLNPQWLVEVSGEWEAESLTVGYQAHYITNSDLISGALAGRDWETFDEIRDQHGVSARGTVTFPAGVTLGATVYDRGVGFDDIPSADEGTERVLHLGGDVEVRTGDATIYAEWLHRGAGDLSAVRRQSIPGSEATYLLAGGQYDLGPLQLRYNTSRADYGDLGREAWIHQPGLTWTFTESVSGIVEYDHWTADLDDGSGDTLDKSLSLVLLWVF